MSIRRTAFVPGEYYHLYNRGNSKQRIFHDSQDYNRFIGLLYACNSIHNFRIYSLNKNESVYDFDRDVLLINIGAYALMPNHFHILATPLNEGDLSKFMQKLTTAYVMYYNKKYGRTGGLFEGKFKSEYLATDRYLKYIFSYIHLNPLKLVDKDWKESGIKDKKLATKFLNTYKYSSYLSYSGQNSKEDIILNKEAFPNYFPTSKKFESEINDWMNYNDLD